MRKHSADCRNRTVVYYLVKLINTNTLMRRMGEVIVTRGGQITLLKEVRDRLEIKEGDLVSVNVIGDAAMISKKKS